MYNTTNGLGIGIYETFSHSQNISLSVDEIYIQNFVEQTLFGGYPMEYAAVLYALIGPYSNWDQKPFRKKPSFYTNLSELAQHYIERGYEEERGILALMMEPTDVIEETDFPYLDVVISHRNVVYDSRILLKSFRSYKSRAHFSIPFIRTGAEEFMPNFDHPIFGADASNGVLLFEEVSSALLAKTEFLTELRRWLSVCPQLFRDYDSEWLDTVRRGDSRMHR